MGTVDDCGDSHNAAVKSKPGKISPRRRGKWGECYIVRTPTHSSASPKRNAQNRLDPIRFRDNLRNPRGGMQQHLRPIQGRRLEHQARAASHSSARMAVEGSGQPSSAIPTNERFR